MSESCHFCHLLAETPQDGITYSDETWAAMCVGDVPGWLTFGTRRHTTNWLWGLSPEEQASLGPLLTRLSVAVREVSGASHVYLLGLGEVSPHFHSMLVPRVDDDMSIERAVHGVLRDQFAERGDHQAALEHAARIRAVL